MLGREKKRESREKMTLWQGRYRRNKEQYQPVLDRMDRRELLYKGTKTVRGAEGAKRVRKAGYVRNLTKELIESQVSSVISQPKVTALRPQDERLAQLIEDMLRNELDRLPMEYNNDQEERTTPMQGGAYSLVEWDTSKRTHQTVGALRVSQLHTKKVIPQDGVYLDIEDMDYLFVDLPQTKSYLKRRYGVDVSEERETEPEVKGPDGPSTDSAEDMVTQHLAYYRNDAGGIGCFSWVDGVEKPLIDLEDYQARRVSYCEKCGQRGDGHACTFCGSERFQEREEAYEVLDRDHVLSDGRVIPAWSPVLDETGTPRTELMTDTAGNAVMRRKTDAMGNPVTDGLGMPELEPEYAPVLEQTQIPYYKPDIYPLLLRRNTSLYGQLLGDSDVDTIEDQQEATKKLETKLFDKLFKGGSVLSMGRETTLDLTDEELRILRLKDPSERNMLGVYNLQPDISGDLTAINQVYEEARQELGITNAYQGREDRTAASGKAKEFSAKQSAGRLESKRAMKDAYFSRLFEAMFKFMLAYADEPRTVVARDNQGHSRYETFDRYEFLEQDEAGEWYWNDRFLFSVDEAATLAQDREALWQEARLNFQQGAYGPQQETQTLLIFWTRMEKLHYPGAGDMKTHFEEQMKKQAEAETLAAAARKEQSAALAGSGVSAAGPDGGSARL